MSSRIITCNFPFPLSLSLTLSFKLSSAKHKQNFWLKTFSSIIFNFVKKLVGTTFLNLSSISQAVKGTVFSTTFQLFRQGTLSFFTGRAELHGLDVCSLNLSLSIISLFLFSGT